jgi:hypothetical protein
MKWIIPVLASMMLASAAWAQVPDEGFERWDSIPGGEKPPGWSGGPFGFGKAESPHRGDFAASVWNWYYYAKGYLRSGNVQNSLPGILDIGGVPISYKPVKLSGYYRYVLGENGGKNDSAVLRVMLRRYNAGAGRIDTIGYAAKRLGPAGAYTPFSLDIPDYAPGVDPDSVVIEFMSSDSGFCNVESNGNCCYLSVDDLYLVTASGVPHNAVSFFESVRVQPNPMTVEASIRWDAAPGREYRLLVYDVAGRLVRTAAGLTGVATLDRAGLPPGEYLIEIRDVAGTVAARGRVTMR